MSLDLTSNMKYAAAAVGAVGAVGAVVGVGAAGAVGAVGGGGGGLQHPPDDKQQALVKTPFGPGMVIRTRRPTRIAPAMHEIELIDWNSTAALAQTQAQTRSPRRPTMLYSPTLYPSIPPTVGCDVITLYGRGTVLRIRNETQIMVVKITSWRLAGRSSVKCYLSCDSAQVQVVRPKRLHEMTVHEKVERAQALKEQAAKQFSRKRFREALQLYAEAVDAVRYVQHKKDSTNQLRADLLVVMITCCNNAATCCLQIREWDRAHKFGKNSLVLIDALYEKRGKSKIHQLLNHEGTTDSKLFGTWKAKSLLVIARGLAESHEAHGAIDNIKLALETISVYKNENQGEGDPIVRQLQGQEKEVRKLLGGCRDQLKLERKKEKERAKAMFGGAESQKPPEKATIETANGTKHSGETNIFEEGPSGTSSSQSKPKSLLRETDDKADDSRRRPLKKRVSFADGSTPGSVDDNTTSSFFEEHKEALLISVGGILLGSLCAQVLWRKTR